MTRKVVTAAAIMDPAVAIDSPEFVVRYVVLCAIAEYQRRNRGKLPRRMRIPPLVEVSLEVDRARNQGVRGPIRDEPTLYGVAVEWGADEFRLE